MTKKELEFLKKILEHIKDSDGHIARALAYVNKDLAIYKSREGQLREMYECEDRSF